MPKNPRATPWERYRYPKPSESPVPQSLAQVLVHIVFSTKHRVQVLLPEIRTELHPYLAVVLKNDGCPSRQVGGIADHVHLLFALSRTRTIAEVVENVKTSSSKWIKTKSPELADFHWQGGYGAFSVSKSQSETVIEYIRKQEEHHAKRTFQDEVRHLYQRHEIEFDERYVWD